MPDKNQDPTAPGPDLPPGNALDAGGALPPQEPRALVDAPPSPGGEASHPAEAADQFAQDALSVHAADAREHGDGGNVVPPQELRAPVSASPSPGGEASHPAPSSDQVVREAPALHAADADEHEYESGPSLAGRLLMALVLLLLGAGLGIWAAPRVAPHLPSGLAPVAAWLAPAEPETEARLSELQSEFTALQQRMDAQNQPADVDARVSEAVSALEARFLGEIAALRDEIAAVGGGEDFRSRLSEIESAVEGQTAELDALMQQIEGGAAAGGAAAEEVAQSIDVYRAELEGLRGEFTALTEQVASLSDRIEQVAANADRRVAEAEDRAAEAEAQAAEQLTTAETEAALAEIRSALSSGEPYSEPLTRLAQGRPISAETLAPAQEGVATMLELREAFPEAAHQAIRSSIVASGQEGGVLARSRAFLEAQVASRSLSPQAGMDPDAVLSRIEEALRIGDLDAALSEAENLPEEARAAMSDWLARAEERFEAVRGFETIANAEPTATN